MFSYFENRKTTYFDVFCLNFSTETKIKTLFLISYFNLSKKTKWHFGYTDSLRLARVVKTQAFKTTKSIENLKNGKQIM